MTLSNADANKSVTVLPDLADIHPLAAFLAAQHGADTIVEVGCGHGHRLMALEGFRRVGIDRPSIIERSRQAFPAGTWIEAVFEGGSRLLPDDELAARPVVICANVFGIAANPAELLALLFQLSRNARAMLLAAPALNTSPGDPDELRP